MLQRTKSENLESILHKEFKVLDKGFIRVVDYMGDEAAITQMARVSYGAGTKTVNEDAGLIKYLLQHQHTSPFEGCIIKLHLKMPMFVARQWIRHRTASLNEYSARYSEVKEEYYVPERETILKQSETNKQGRNGKLDEVIKDSFINSVEETSKRCFQEYSTSLNTLEISRELARITLPLNTYTELYWVMDLHNLLHFVSLRSDPHAQYEIRVYSDIILHEIIKLWLPNVYQFFNEFNLNRGGAKLSKSELKALYPLKNIILENMQAANISKRDIETLTRKLENARK